MAIRVYKPTTAGRRNASVSDFSELTRSTPEKSLVRKLSKTGGRNSYGRITSRHRGGGHKRQYRLIDFKRWDKDGVPAKVAHIEYDPNRPPASHCCTTQTARSVTSSLRKASSRATSSRPALRLISSRATTCRCATSRPVPWCTRLSSARWVAPRSPAPPVLPCSSSPRMAPTLSCVCRPAKSATWTLAAARPLVRSATDHANIQLGKAGRARWMGKRPITRGESMNPVDHPHGGRTRGGKPPVSPWGKGEVRTRRPKKASNKMIVRRRPNGKNRK